MAFAAVSGLADVDAITLSMARLGRTDLSAQTAALAILLALGVNSASKAVLATMAGGRAIGALVTTGTALAFLLRDSPAFGLLQLGISVRQANNRLYAKSASLKLAA